MKGNRKNNYIIAAAAFLLVYLLLLAVLLYSEKGQPGSEIDSFSDALWFSLVTISSVGYGDLTPVTPAGHVVGVVFLLMSMGVFVALFGSVVSALTSEGFPMMRLRFLRKKNWYYFSEFTTEANALSKDILKEDPDAVIIYGANKDSEKEKPDHPCFFINVSPARIVEHKKGEGKRCKLFFLEEDSIGSSMKAVDVHMLDADVYARTMSGQEKMSGNINFFHSYDCCARSYWRDNPLGPSEDIVVIIGFGNYGTAILERAILMNINDSDFDISYHVFGDPARFMRIHRDLSLSMGINEKRPGHDSIFFHDEDWTEAHDIIASADRIIICEDREETGWDDYWHIQRFYESKGKIYLRSNRTAPGVAYFGTNEQIYTVNQIVRTRLNDAARIMNDLYRRSVGDSLDWDELSDQLRQSKIATADHLLVKIRILLDDSTVTSFDKETFKKAYEALREVTAEPEKLDAFRRIEHARWMRFYTYYNWEYGEEHDEAKKQDPMIREYDQLTEEQRSYFDRAWDLIGEIASSEWSDIEKI